MKWNISKLSPFTCDPTFKFATHLHSPACRYTPFPPPLTFSSAKSSTVSSNDLLHQGQSPQPIWYVNVFLDNLHVLYGKDAKRFYTGCPSCHNPPHLSRCGTSTWNNNVVGPCEIMLKVCTSMTVHYLTSSVADGKKNTGKTTKMLSLYKCVDLIVMRQPVS